MLQLDHVVLPVSRVRESLTFYGDVLGLPLVESHEGDDWGGYPWLMLLFGLGDKRQIVLVGFAGAPEPPRSLLPKDARHVALAETTSLDAWRTKLQEAAVDFWEEDHGGQLSLYFEDPNGYVLEITSPPTASPSTPSKAAQRRAERWLEKHREAAR